MIDLISNYWGFVVISLVFCIPGIVQIVAMSFDKITRGKSES